MKTETTPLLYRWGRWIWYYRALALITYITVLLAFIGFGDIIRDLLQEPTAANLLLVALSVLLLASCALWSWTTWLQGNRRVGWIALSTDQNMLTVKTLNFTIRTIPVADLGQITYSATQHYATPHYVGSDEVYEPTLMVDVQRAAPLRIDMQGHIVDEALFKAVFPYDPNPRAVPHRKKGKGREVPAKR